MLQANTTFSAQPDSFIYVIGRVARQHPTSAGRAQLTHSRPNVRRHRVSRVGVKSRSRAGPTLVGVIGFCDDGVVVMRCPAVGVSARSPSAVTRVCNNIATGRLMTTTTMTSPGHGAP